MGQNLTGQTIASTYEDLVQISGSILTNGLGSDINSLTVTASYATNAGNALTANTAGTAATATTASFAITASYALNAGVTVDTGSLMVTGSATGNVLTFTKGNGSTFNLTVDTGSATATPTGSLLVTASISNATTTFTKGDGSTFSITANNVVNATSASFATTATTATSASHALNADNAITASYALNVTPINTGSFYVSSSVNNATITFNQGDGTTEAVTVNNVVNATSASFATNANTANSATSASFATNAATASLAQNIVSGLSPTFTNATVTNNLTVNGTASIAVLNYVTGSATYIGDSFIVVNTDLPAQRYAGLAVFDSGSSPQFSASLEWDGEDDVWILKEETGNTSVILTGPTGSKGAEIFPTANKLQKGGGWNYILDSSITDDGARVSSAVSVTVTGSVTASLGFNGNLAGTASLASFATTASYALNAGGGTFPFTGSAQITGSLGITGSISLLSGSFSGSVVDNITDIYTSSPAIKHLISLTQAEYNAISSSADPDTLYYIIDAPSFVTSASYALSSSYALSATTATSASFATTALTASYVLNAVSASFATTASFYSLASVDQDVVITGSVRGNVGALSISSNTASMDLSTGNFFTLQLVSGSNTFINPTNILPGQTINLRVNTTGSGTVSFPSSIKQVSGSAYVPTTTTGVDVVTFISFDTASLLLSNVKNLI